jgi:hypothetical protein
VSAVDCDQCVEVAPELALGIADGDERAEAVAHLTACPACRRELEDLATTADRLLLLAPTMDPPAGFAPTTLARCARPAPGHPGIRRRAPRPVRAAAALAAVFVAGVVGGRARAPSVAGIDDVGHDGPLRTAALTDGSGRPAGGVAVQEGATPRIVVMLGPDPPDDRYQVRCDDAAGGSFAAGALSVAAEDRGGKVWTAVVSFPVAGIRLVRLVGDSGGNDLVAPLGPA